MLGGTLQMLSKKILATISIAGLLFSVWAPVYAASNSLVINELFYFTNDGGAGDTSQWLEIRNLSTTQSVDLSATLLTVEVSSSTVWQGGTAASFNISTSHIIAPGEHFLISNTAGNVGLGGNFVFADFVVSDIPFLRRGIGSANTSTRGVRLKLDGTVTDTVMYGRTDADLVFPTISSSKNTQQLDVDGYYVLNTVDSETGLTPTTPAGVSILIGTTQGNSLGRDQSNPVDTDQLTDWTRFAAPTPEAGNTTVPEPSAVVLFMAGVLYFKRRLKRL